MYPHILHIHEPAKETPRSSLPNGAFLVSASLEEGTISAEIVSERGMPLTIEAPDNGYILVMDSGERIPLTEQLTTVNTRPNQRIKLIKE